MGPYLSTVDELILPPALREFPIKDTRRPFDVNVKGAFLRL